MPGIVVYEENGIDANGMDYSKLTPLLIEAVKAQQKIIEELKIVVTENSKLKNEITTMKTILNKMIKYPKKIKVSKK